MVARELTSAEMREIRGLVRQCANFDHTGPLCLLTDAACPMLAATDDGQLCDYFRAAVLPVSPTLTTRFSQTG